MTIDIPWIWILAARALGICAATGGAIGVTVALVRMRGERRGS